MSDENYALDYESADPPNVLADQFSALVKCLGCGNVMSAGAWQSHTENCSLLHMRRKLRAKENRKRKP